MLVAYAVSPGFNPAPVRLRWTLYPEPIDIICFPPGCSLPCCRQISRAALIAQQHLHRQARAQARARALMNPHD